MDHFRFVQHFENKLTADEQWAKLELVRDIAHEVWGAE